MSVLRDIFRRRARSVLTISGIGVGVFALVVLGAVAENDNVYVDRLVGYYQDIITVVEKDDANFVGMSSGNRPLSMETVEELRGFPGVRDVSPMVSLLLDDEYVSVIPPLVLGVEAEAEDYQGFELSSGRGLRERDAQAAILGSDLAKQRGIGVGDTIEVRDETFSIVGIMGRTYVNLLDSAVFINLADAQQLYFDSLPEAFQTNVTAEDLVLQMNVYVEPDEDPDLVADALNRDFDGILATGPTKMMDTVDGLVGLLNAVVWSIAAIALLVSGLSIVNTMTMAVAERTREIGVKRALGASRWRIARDVLAESAVMGGLGGVGGLAVGSLATWALNSAMVATTGTTALVLTWRLAFGALAFAIILGALGGLYPARYAARLEPATALAHE